MNTAQNKKKIDRVIKFRAWDKDKQEMVSWDILKTTYGLFLDTPNDWLSDCMQFTGLTDKNGKEIYEGDIVVGNYFNLGQELSSDPMCVIWGYCSWGLQYIDSRSAPSFVDWAKIEVIGNVWENPELLGKDSND